MIPVILPGCESIELPLFLKAYTWVDCRAGLTEETVQRDLIWGITGDKNRELILSLVTDDSGREADSDVVPVFIFNDINEELAEFFDSSIRPVLNDADLAYRSLSDVDAATHLAHSLEEITFDTSIVLLILNESSPYVPLALLSPTASRTDVIVLVERSISPPEILSYSTIIRYTTNRKGINKLQENLKNALDLRFSTDRLHESEKLFSLKFYDAAVVAAGQGLTDFLRMRAAEALSIKYFREKPFRF
ncbi:MAG: hypothetical protein GY721_11840 [Deltaproteobacteria bacterium]|nr:hypothetical protein [Deltaproteobacteria bacterium]